MWWLVIVADDCELHVILPVVHCFAKSVVSCFGFWSCVGSVASRQLVHPLSLAHSDIACLFLLSAHHRWILYSKIMLIPLRRWKRVCSPLEGYCKDALLKSLCKNVRLSTFSNTHHYSSPQHRNFKRRHRQYSYLSDIIIPLLRNTFPSYVTVTYYLGYYLGSICMNNTTIYNCPQ